MYKTVLQVEGMMCGMCETHINDAIRAACPVKKVSSSHTKGRTVVESQVPLDEKALRAAIDATGYTVISCTSEEIAKRGFFGRR